MKTNETIVPESKAACSTYELVKSLYRDELGRAFSLTPAQNEIFDCIFKKKSPDGKSRMHIMTHTQFGKQIAHDVPVLSKCGWKKHGDLKKGDYVYGIDGKLKKVLALSEESESTREVSFSNRENIQCHENHEWIVKHNNWKRRKNEFKIIETKKLEEYVLKGNSYVFSLPEVMAIDFESFSDIPIDPYTFGVWLGDGKSDGPTICGNIDDLKIISKRIPYEYSSELVHKKTGVLYRFYGRTLFARGLSLLNVKNNKHIPECYKYSSVEDRKSLIAGLIDTDGTVNKSERENGWKNGRIYIANANKKLIDDIEEVLRSLGVRFVSVVRVPACVSSSGIIGKQDVYYLGFSPVIDFPTSLPRKKIIVRNTKRSKTVAITGIKKIEPKKGRCIMVEGGIYLVGKKLVPTHNSDVVSMAVLTRAATFGEKWVIVAPSQSKARIIIGFCVKHIFDNEFTTSRFKIKEGESLESIRRERSKNRLTFDVGDNRIGEIFILSAESRLKQSEDIGNALMGFGCIIAGYRVMTNKGEMFIDEVVKNRSDVKILSYNHKTNKTEYKRILEYQENNIGNRYILEFEVDGKIFRCTNNHPVYIDKIGYIRADEVKEGDKVLIL